MFNVKLCVAAVTLCSVLNHNVVVLFDQGITDFNAFSVSNKIALPKIALMDIGNSL
jgi:hypothetical protein